MRRCVACRYGDRDSEADQTASFLCEVGQMMDVLFVVVTLLFFLLSWLYVRACERV